MSPAFYKVLHLLAVIYVFFAYGALTMLGAEGIDAELRAKLRRPVVMIHGIAMLVIFVSAFGLMAKLGIMGGAWPAWIYGKLALWLVVGAAVALARRRPDLARRWYVLLPLLGGVGAYLAYAKPM